MIIPHFIDLWFKKKPKNIKTLNQISNYDAKVYI